MKGVVIRSPAGLDRLELVDLPDPGAPGPGEIRVRVHGSSLNYHDYVVATGARTPDGRIPLSDAAGVVEAVGEGVTEFRAGDAVISCFFPYWQDGEATIGHFKTVPGDGLDGYAREVVVTPANWFTRAPKGYDHFQAATLPTAGLTAWRSLVVDGQLKAGDVVLLLGTGGVSIFALQLAKAMGATVILTSSSDEKLERAKEMGADHTINYRQHEEWGRMVLDLTGGIGADHVIEVGGPGTLAQSIRAVRVGGHISLMGVLTGHSGPIPTALLMAKQARLKGVMVGSRRHQLDFVRAVEAIGLRPVVDRTFPLAQIAEAFRFEKEGRHFGKIAIEI